MKKARSILVALLVISVLFVAGCTSSKPAPKPEDPNSNVNNPNNNTEDPNSNVVTEPKISVEFVSAELLKDKKEYYYFSETDPSENIIFTSDIEVQNFRFIAVVYVETENTFKLQEEKLLYAHGTLVPKKPLVISTSFPGTIPNRGIAYTDANNVDHYFALSLSGEDGSVLLIAFENFT